MKSFIIVILLALLAGIVGYDFAYPRLADWAKFETLSVKKPVEARLMPNPVPPPPAQSDKLPIPESKPVIDAPAIETPVIKTPVIEPEMTPPAPSPKPESPKPEPAKIVEAPKKVTHPDEFQPPVFPPIEEVVKGWKEIPKKAFPREVTLLKDVEFIASKDGNKFGTKVASGSKAHVLDQNGDKVIVAPTSMKSGGVTEITPANIRKWGNLNVERIDGQEYYTVIVDYTTKTMFGDFDTSAQARIRNGKVVKWIYTGSGEVVP
ncbi:MAG: hypothetical protein K8R87_06360 [Verrucomicrobia bacterium]|nr:hypothetical protein [Verrucomicrobiota bacterium]